MMVRQQQVPPPWLQILMEKEFYEDKNNKCETHTSQYKTCFCIICNADFFCPKDTATAAAHERHTIVQVFRVSHQASVDLKEFKKIWSNIEDIQPYKINSRCVILLNRNLKIKETNNNINKQQQHPCRTCTHMITLDYNFCSINCKCTFGNDNGAENSNEREVDGVGLASPLNENALTSANSRRLKQKRIINKKPYRGASKERIDRPEPPVMVAMAVAAVNEAAEIRVVPRKPSRRKSRTPCRSPLM